MAEIRSAHGCCTEPCDLAAPYCSGESIGQVCVPLYPMGAVQEGLDDLGYCTAIAARHRARVLGGARGNHAMAPWC
jgi:hypothetical protein